MNKNQSKKHIEYRELVHMSFANLRHKRSRSIITFLGVMIGVGSIYLLLSFGLGVQSLLEGQVATGKSMNVIDVSVVNSEILTLDQETLKTLRKLPAVTEVTTVTTSAGKISKKDATTDVVVYKVDPIYFSLTNLRLEEGNLPHSSNEKGVVVNRGLLDLIGVSDISKAIGEKLSITIPGASNDARPVEYTVPIVAVIDSTTGSELFMLNNAVKGSESASFSLIKVLARSQDDVPQVREVIEGLGFATSSPLDTIKQLRDTSLIVNLVLASLGSIGILIAALGMINTLTISLIERTREIALMMTIGARRRDIFLLFMNDTLLLTIIGGVLGVSFGILLGKIIDYSLNVLAKERGAVDSFSLFVASPQLIVGAIAIMVIIGLLVAIFPARRASRINPVDAMREE